MGPLPSSAASYTAPNSAASPAITHFNVHRPASSNGKIAPWNTAGPTGMTPAQVRHAYGIDNIKFSGVTGDGTGTTIAIVDAYDDPTIAYDLQQFDLAYHLADPPAFIKVNQTGGTNYPAADSGWAGEIALDVEWAHAIAPKAKILLVEAASATDADLYAAVDYARNYSNVVAVSMSWGGSEASTETGDDYHFTTPNGHTGVTFLVSSGDTGAPAEYPSCSPNVISVGGTSLSTDSQGNVTSEAAWSGSGGGLSKYESQPSYQSGLVIHNGSSTVSANGKRATPDVAYNSDPNMGFGVYDSYNNGTTTPWGQWGGTSAAAPQWAGIVAIANQGSVAAGKGYLDGVTQVLPKLYSVSATDYRDITSGASNGRPNYTAGTGYDLATGLGTPHADFLVADFVGQVTQTATHFSVSTSASTTAGSTISVTVSALDANNAVVSGYTGTVHFTSSDSQATLPSNYTFAAGDNGSHTFSTIVLKTAGSQSVAVTDIAAGSITGFASVTVNPAAASQLAFGQQPSNVQAGGSISPAVTVRVLDAYNNLTSNNSLQISVAIGTNPGSGSLSGTTSVTANGGAAMFNNLAINAQGNGYTLVASANGVLSATSIAFNVTPIPVATHLSVSTSTSSTAGSTISVVVTARDASNNVVPGYLGTVHFSSTDNQAVLPSNYTFVASDNGVHTFTTAVLKTAGSRTVTATDIQAGSINGSASVTVNPGTVTQLSFAQQPSNVEAGAAMAPAVTVQAFDAYNNLATNNSSLQVTVAIAANPSGGTLSGIASVALSNGVAAFSNLSIDKAGTGYTLAASASGASAVTSNAFNVTPSSTVTLEDFENIAHYRLAGGFPITASFASSAKHNGAMGLKDAPGNDWIYRDDDAAQLQPGDTLSVWTEFAGTSNVQAFFGFGTSKAGTLSLVASPGTSQLMFQDNINWGSTVLGTPASISFQAMHWYRLQVQWSTTGAIHGQVFDSDGTTLLGSVSASNSVYTSGGFGFKETGSASTYWDTVQRTPNVNSFAINAAMGAAAAQSLGSNDSNPSNRLSASLVDKVMSMT